MWISLNVQVLFAPVIDFRLSLSNIETEFILPP